MYKRKYDDPTVASIQYSAMSRQQLARILDVIHPFIGGLHQVAELADNGAGKSNQNRLSSRQDSI